MYDECLKKLYTTGVSLSHTFRCFFFLLNNVALCVVT